MSAKEESDKVILPETPPSIEYFRKTTVDKPVLRRQNFITDPEISRLPAVSVAEFKKFYDENYPIHIGISYGSFGAFEGNFILSSTENWHAGFKTNYTDGETEKLYSKENIFEFQTEQFANENVKVSADAVSDEKTVWLEKKDYYSVNGACSFYVRENMNIKTSVGGNIIEMKNLDENRSLLTELIFNWQPFSENTLLFHVSDETNSALSRYKNIIIFDLKYAFMPLSTITFSAGTNFYKDKFYPMADFAWHIISPLRFNVAYETGIEKRAYKDLYFNNYYEIPFYDIIFPEKTFSLKEKIGYYLNEDFSMELECSQTDYNNHIYREQVFGTDFVTLANFDKKYISSSKVTFNNKDKYFSKNVSIIVNSDNDMPFVPEVSLDASIGYSLYKWNFDFGYNYLSSMYFSRNNSDKLPESGDMSLSISRGIGKEIEMTIKLDNIFSEKIETQPGFLRKSLLINAGVKIRF